MASAFLVALLSFPGFPARFGGAHHGFDDHPIATAIAVAAVLVFIGWDFRRNRVQ
jgi:hypothetical protein